MKSAPWIAFAVGRASIAPCFLAAALSACGGGPGPGDAAGGKGGAANAGAAGHAQAGKAGNGAAGSGQAGSQSASGAAGGEGGSDESAGGAGTGGNGGGGTGKGGAGAGGHEAMVGGAGGSSGRPAGNGGTAGSGTGGTGEAGPGGTGWLPAGGTCNGGMSGSDAAGSGMGGSATGGAGASGAGMSGGTSGAAGATGGSGGGSGNGCVGEPVVDCPCLKVTLDGDDVAASTSAGALPFKTVQAAIDFASAHREIATDVCAAPGPGCGATAAFEYGLDGRNLTMADGVSVYGNYESTGWTRCTDSTSELRSELLGAGVLFGAGISHETVLDGFVINGAVEASGATVLADGATNVVLSNVNVGGYFAIGPRTVGVLAVNGAQIAIANSIVNVNPGKPDVAAVAANGARVTVTDSTLGAMGTATIATVELVDAAGSSVKDSTLRLTGNLESPVPTQDGAAVRVRGAADDVVIEGNIVTATGPYYSLVGIAAEDCSGAPSLSYNQVRADNPSSGYASGQPATVALSVTGSACAAYVAGNSLMSVGGANIANVALACSAPCVISYNSLGCDKSGTQPNATQGGATGLVCTGCTEISSNQIVGLVSPSGIHLSTSYHALGASVTGPTLVARNAIHGGCGGDSVGISATNARLENNLISGRDYDESCGYQPTYANSSIGLLAGHDADIHSNYIHSSLNSSASTGVVTNSSDVTLRNNFLAGFQAALTGSWLALENNAFDGAAAGVSNAAALNALPGASGNIFGDCTRSATSPCIDAGTTTGAPATDYNGLPRDSKPDIGPYEYVASADPCADRTCSGHGSCFITTTGAACSCAFGYKQADGDPLSCVVDPCANNGGCDGLTSCTPTGDGGRTCGACPYGYSGTGDTHCTDIDECATDNGGCDPLTTCQNTTGSRSCGPCPQGYGGYGDTGCIAMPWCTPNPCTHEASCWSDTSDYICNCPPGTTGKNCELAFTQIVGSYWSFCGLRTDGTARCWGRNSGNEATPPSGSLLAIDLGDGFGCAVKADGSLACFGRNGDGETSPPSGTFTAVATGDAHACAIRGDGTLACWGSDSFGQADAPAGSFIGVAAGREFTCALSTAHTLSCWGNPADSRTSPPSGSFDALDVGDAFGCARAASGILSCWGSDSNGQLGVPYDVYSKFSLSSASGLAIRADGTLTHWGYSGDNLGGARIGTFAVIGAGTHAECAVRPTYDTVMCWGTTDNGLTTPPSGPP